MKLEELLEHREQLLKNNPKLREFQADIDIILDASPDRLGTITLLLQAKLNELNDKLNELKGLIS